MFRILSWAIQINPATKLQEAWKVSTGVTKTKTMVLMTLSESGKSEDFQGAALPKMTRKADWGGLSAPAAVYAVRDEVETGNGLHDCKEVLGRNPCS